MIRGPKPSGRTKLIATMVSPETHARVMAEVRRRGVTVSVLLHDLLVPALAQLPTVADPATAPAPQPEPSRRPRRGQRPLPRGIVGPIESRDLTAIIMGDPAPERSALGQRR
jgi:hypothetical protein